MVKQQLVSKDREHIHGQAGYEMSTGGLEPHPQRMKTKAKTLRCIGCDLHLQEIKDRLLRLFS